MRAGLGAMPLLLEHLCDDAAVFPPGNLPLDQAVPAHLVHRSSGHRELVGEFVVAAAQLPDLGRLLAGEPAGSFEVAMTVPSPAGVGSALSDADAIPAVVAAALEVAVPSDVLADDVVPALDSALGRRRREVSVFVELPRDARRSDLLAELVGTPYLAKLRTGGVHADLYPDEAELAAAVVACVRAGMPFKATAGLHHAIRNTDPDTGFVQHGFLNVITAVDAALTGSDSLHVERLLAERGAAEVAARVRDADPRASRVRELFRSFGTCSILEPLEELQALGLLQLPDEPTEPTGPAGRRTRGDLP